MDLIALYSAYRWGMKAAEEGLSISDNPYRSENRRAAWRKGHRISAIEESTTPPMNEQRHASDMTGPRPHR